MKGFFAAIVWIIFSIGAYAQNDNITITIEFDGAPTSVEVSPAALKYNKEFAYSYTLDDGLISAYTVVYNLFHGGFIEGNSTTYPGLYYTDGCGNDIPFRAGLAMWTWKGSNDEDMHTDPNGYGAMTWAQIDELYEAGWDVFNHGFTHGNGPGTDYVYEIEQNYNYVKDITSNHIDMTHFVIPAGDTNYIQPVLSSGDYKVIYNQGGHDFVGGSNGLQIDGDIDYDDMRILRKTVKTALADNISRIDDIASNSNSTNHLWYNDFNHGVDNFGDEPFGFLFETFKDYMEHVESAYGKSGNDKVWMAPLQEVYEYLSVRDNITSCHNLSGNTLTINLNTDQIPEDLRRYALSLNINSDVNFSSVSVAGASDYTFNGSGAQKLINLQWETSSFNPDAPVWDAPASFSCQTGQSCTMEINSTDPQGDPITIGAVSGIPSFATPVILGDGVAQLQLNPTLSDAGFYPVVLSFSDDNGNTNNFSTELVVSIPGNSPPEIDGPSVINVEINSVSSHPFTGIDSDTESTEISAVSLPCFASLSATSGSGIANLNLSPQISDLGIHNIELTVTDNSGGRSTYTVTINVVETLITGEVKIPLNTGMIIEADPGNHEATHLVDEQPLAGEPGEGIAGSPAGESWFPGTSASYPHTSFIDLGVLYDLTKVYLHDVNSNGLFKIYYGSPGDWTLLISEPCTSYFLWKEHLVDVQTRYLQFEMESSGAKVNEIVLYGSSTLSDIVPPAAVSNLSLNSFDCEKARIVWNATGDDQYAGTATSYDIRYSTSIINEGNFDAATAVSPVPLPEASGSLQFADITGLNPSSSFYFAMKVVDDHGNASQISNITGPVSIAVSGLSAATNLAGTGVTLGWNALAGANLYQVKGRKAGQTAFGKFITANNNKNIAGLLPNTTYEWTIRARCSSGLVTGFTDLVNFFTATGSARQLEDNNLSNLTIDIFPNPADDELFVVLDPAVVSEITISDLSGRVLERKSITSTSVSTIAEVPLDVSSYQQGLYHVNVKSDTDSKSKLVFIK